MQSSVQGVVYYVHPSSGSCKVVTKYGIVKKPRASLAESFPTDMVSVLNDDATVPAQLAVYRRLILAGDFRENSVKKKTVSSIAKITDDFQRERRM